MGTEWVRGHKAGQRFPSYLDAQREAADNRGGRWDYFIEPMLNTKRVPVDDLEFIGMEYPHTEGR